MEFIRWLEEIGRDDVEVAGGKGANLGELTHIGVKVPAGFVVLTSAYRLFVEENDLQGEIERLVDQMMRTDPSSIEQTSLAIRTLFDNGHMPEAIISSVRAAYVKMTDGAVAVRSSASAEDLPGASFAGQQETYLNISTENGLLMAIQHCWSSLWTSRALAYRSRQQINTATIKLAVVVQEMVWASVSGVLFTLNPVSGADEVVINAIWGLGEALVGGQVTPDTIISNKRTGEVKRVEIGKKLVMTVPDAHGTREQDVDPALRQKAVLSNSQVAELTALGGQIETHFGVPQDIEWAIADGQIFVLQARPITTYPREVPPGDDTWDRDGDMSPQPYDLWTRTNVGENLAFPLTPLTSTNFPKLFSLDTASSKQAASSFQATRRFYGRLYFNEGAMLHELQEKYGIPASFMDRFWGSRRRGEQQVRGHFHPFLFLRKLPSLLGQFSNSSKQKIPKHTPTQFFAQIDQWVNNFLQQDVSLLDDDALWRQGLPIWRERGAYAFATNIRISMPSAFFYAALERLVKWWTGRKELTQDLVIGLPGMYNTEVGPALWDMAQTLQEQCLDHILLEYSPVDALKLLYQHPEAQAFIGQLESFLQCHGHRCPNELELLNMRWAEAPELVIELIANYVRAGEKVNPIEAEKRQQHRRDATTAAVEKKLGPVRRAIFRKILKKAQQAIVVRDNSRYAMAKFIFPMRKLYAQLGRRWMDRGWLLQADDIFFLTVSEIEGIIENDASSVAPQRLQSLVANRRIAYEYWLTVVAPDAIGPDGKPIIEDVSGISTLSGLPASSGCVRGRARIVTDVREAMQLTPGDILVTQATDPGWTPVFPLVSGIVLEIGGQLSHGAIVAREYGIPAVINVPGAMHTIKDGQAITVDGTNGRIYLDEDISAERDYR